MTTEEAKEYCINIIGMSEDDFTKATDEDVACELAEENEWVHEFNEQVPEGLSEASMKTAVDIATDHKFWNDPKNVDSYLEFYMSQEEE